MYKFVKPNGEAVDSTWSGPIHFVNENEEIIAACPGPHVMAHFTDDGLLDPTSGKLLSYNPITGACDDKDYTTKDEHGNLEEHDLVAYGDASDFNYWNLTKEIHNEDFAALICGHIASLWIQTCMFDKLIKTLT